jgi:hypothetical protein
MDEKTIHELIGKRALWTVEGIGVMVEIKATRRAYGRYDALISPIDGEGEKWVGIAGLKIQEGGEKCSG